MGGGQHAPTPFQPPNQAGSAAAFQAGAGQLAQAGSQLYGQVSPELSGLAYNVVNNPYYTGAQAGAGAAATMANNSVVPSMYRGMGQDTGVASLAALASPYYSSQAQNNSTTAQGNSTTAQGGIPGTTQGASYAPGVFGALATGGGQTYGADLSALGNLGTAGLQAGNQILNTGFDPQQALYNQEYQRMLDQTNAINAQNGVAGTPYAAGIGAQNETNFNIDWNNAQLNREIQALGAYDQAASTYAGDTANLASGAINNLATGVGTGVNAYTGLTSNTANNLATLLGASNNSIATSNNALATGANNLATLGATTVGANAGADQLGQDALNTQAGAAQLQYDLQNQQQFAGEQAVLGQIQGTNASLGPTQQAVADQGTYMNIGQTAAQGAIQAAQVNNQAAAASAAGFGNLFGDVLGMFSPIKLG